MQPKTKRRLAGFTLIELMVAMGVVMVLLYAAVLAFRDASQTNTKVTQDADMSDNLRSALNLIQTDLQQAGSGIPTGGIPIPYTSNNSSTNPCGTTPPPNRPVLGGDTTFPACHSTFPGVEPGNALGPLISAPDATTGLPSNPSNFTDEITVFYADNLGLDSRPINALATTNPANPGCPNGSLTLSGTTLTAVFDGSTMNSNGNYNCVNFAKNGITVSPGDLIMFSNTLGEAVLAVTSVSGQVLTFASGDAFNLNGRTEAGGTIKQLETNGCGGTNACFANTSATRIWMVSYYLDNITSPPYIRLIRQVGFNTATPVGETLENLQFTYNFVDGNGNPANQPTVPTGDSESQIMCVNVYLAARSSYLMRQGNTAHYSRDNLMTQVSLRSMAYQNVY
ncbi:MAG: prepilin-type N-terminal cleavage/methylation domain-containing protein [Candidatus Acidiferrum sp.]